MRANTLNGLNLPGLKSVGMLDKSEIDWAIETLGFGDDMNLRFASLGCCLIGFDGDISVGLDIWFGIIVVGLNGCGDCSGSGG